MPGQINGPAIFNVAAPQITKYTCQLFRIKNGVPSHFGCAVLLRHDTNYYCLSNAHVLIDGDYSNLFILSETGLFLSLAGTFSFTPMPSTGNRQDDPLDLVVLHLNTESVNGLTKGGYSFLSIYNVKTNYTPEKKDVALVVGYPSSLTKLDFKNRNIIKQPLFYATVFVTQNLTKLQTTYHSHHFVRYPRKSLINLRIKNRRIGPKPHGMSGSGLWQIGKIDEKYYPLLIGIGSEYLENRALLVYIKIDFFIAAIRQYSYQKGISMETNEDFHKQI